MKRKAEQLRKAYKEQYGDAVPEVVGGLFNGDGQLEQLDVVEPNAPAPVQPPQRTQPQQQPTAVPKQAPVRQPAQPRPQAPAVSPNT